MRPATLVALLLGAAGLHASQAPLYDHGLTKSSGAPFIPLPALNFSSTAPYLFAAARGLLQQLSNTVFPNGYSLAACTLPAYTLLYHGLKSSGAPDSDDSTPASPEWLALDLEMAYGIMGSTRHSWLLTYQSTRPVRLLYFDGESATLMGLGQLDSQMLVLYGNVSGPGSQGSGNFSPLGDEYARARGLCDWLEQEGLRGHGWGFEGIVRMNAGFEVIWCDFLSDSLRLLSRLNVTAPMEVEEETAEPEAEKLENEQPEKEQPELKQDSPSYYPLPPVPTRSDRVADPTAPPAPPNWRRPDGQTAREPFLEAQGWGWFESATWHYGSSRGSPGGGETRLRIDSCAILSFYAPRFTDGPLALARLADEQKTLNLTADGLWDAARASNRTLALHQLGRRRRYHHLGSASPEEAAAMRESTAKALARVLARGQSEDAACSGAEWTLLFAEIVQRTTAQLKTMEVLLANDTVDAADTPLQDRREWLRRLRAQTHMFSVGYVEYPASASAANTTAWRPYSALFNQSLALCRYRYTRLLVPDGSATARTLPPEEADMRWALEETYGTVCEQLLTISFDIEREWTQRFTGTSLLADRALPRAQWADRLALLIAWLGWEGEFLGCSRVCDWDERCFIPMWPMTNKNWSRDQFRGGPPGKGRDGRPRGPGGPGGPGGHPGGPGKPGDSDYGGHGGPSFPGFPRSPSMMGDETDLWEPKCVKPWYITGRE